MKRYFFTTVYFFYCIELIHIGCIINIYASVWRFDRHLQTKTSKLNLPVVTVHTIGPAL